MLKIIVFTSHRPKCVYERCLSERKRQGEEERGEQDSVKGGEPSFLDYLGLMGRRDQWGRLGRCDSRARHGERMLRIASKSTSAGHPQSSLFVGLSCEHTVSRGSADKKDAIEFYGIGQIRTTERPLGTDAFPSTVRLQQHEVRKMHDV